MHCQEDPLQYPCLQPGYGVHWSQNSPRHPGRHLKHQDILSFSKGNIIYSPTISGSLGIILSNSWFLGGIRIGRNSLQGNFRCLCNKHDWANVLVNYVIEIKRLSEQEKKKYMMLIIIIVIIIMSMGRDYVSKMRTPSR
jgi:hypothetical protein